MTSRNIGRIIDALKPKEIHFAALQSVLSPMRFRRPHVFMGGELRPPEYDRLDTSLDSVRAVMAEAGSKENRAAASRR
jgi:copper homeostasis protein